MVHVRLVLLLTVVATLLVGCSTRTAGNATPATDDVQGTDQPETSSQTEPDDGAPKVEDPLDASKYEDNPCLALDATQSDELGFGSSGSPVDATLGKACLWENESTRGQVQITFYSEIEDGLSSQYRAQDDGKWAYFEELPAIDGFPAVARDITDNRHNGTCPVAVGLSDELMFEVDLRLPEESIGNDEPCEAAAEAAGMGVQTMKNG